MVRLPVGSDSENGARAAGPAEVGRPVEIAIAGQQEPRVGERPIGTAERVQIGQAARRSDSENGARAARSAQVGRPVEIAVTALARGAACGLDPSRPVNECKLVRVPVGVI